MSESSDPHLVTADEARDRTLMDRHFAVKSVLARLSIDGADLDAIAAEVIDAYQSAPVTHVSDCPHVDPKFGQCEREYRHEPFIVSPWEKRQYDWDGHYTTEYNDPRRPDGTHHWDY